MITHKTGSGRSSQSKAVVHKTSGGQPGNGNAKKTLEWLESYDLTSSDGIRGFLTEIVKRTWTGDLGSRAAGALNGTMRLMLEHELLPELEKRIKVLENEKVKMN